MQEIYTGLARTMMNGVPAHMPDPLDDNTIFNLLGFD